MLKERSSHRFNIVLTYVFVHLWRSWLISSCLTIKALAFRGRLPDQHPAYYHGRLFECDRARMLKFARCGHPRHRSHGSAALTLLLDMLSIECRRCDCIEL